MINNSHDRCFPDLLSHPESIPSIRHNHLPDDRHPTRSLPTGLMSCCDPPYIRGRNFHHHHTPSVPQVENQRFLVLIMELLFQQTWRIFQRQPTIATPIQVNGLPIEPFLIEGSFQPGVKEFKQQGIFHIVGLLQQVDAEAYPSRKILSVLQRRLYQQVLPQFPVEAHIHVIARVFGYQAQILLERRLISNAAHRAVPLAVIVALPMAVRHMDANAVTFQADMLGGGNVIVRKVLAFPVPILRTFSFFPGSLLAVRTVWIIGTDGYSRPPFPFFQRLQFDRKVTVLEA